RRQRSQNIRETLTTDERVWKLWREKPPQPVLFLSVMQGQSGLVDHPQLAWSQEEVLWSAALRSQLSNRTFSLWPPEAWMGKLLVSSRKESGRHPRAGEAPKMAALVWPIPATGRQTPSDLQFSSAVGTISHPEIVFLLLPLLRWVTIPCCNQVFAYI